MSTPSRTPASSPEVGPALRPRDFAWFQSLLYQEAGIHLSDGKQAMLASRLNRRARALGLPDLAAYARHLQNDDADRSERREFVNCLTTNKTEFFREAHHFDFLRRQVLPAFERRAARSGHRQLRIWSAGCSTGEEPYSLAITVSEHLGPRVSAAVQIVASDIDTQVLATAEAGIYDDERCKALPPATRKRYFLRGTGGSAGLWRVRPELKALISFCRVNLNDDQWPFDRLFDVIFCRNVIIYFDRPTQRRLFDRMADRLEPDGYLFLGHSESMLGVSDRFTLLETTVHRLRREGAPAPAPARPALRGTARRPSAGRTTTAAPVADGALVRRIIVGEVFASREPTVVRTLLGSCVSAALLDPYARIGGMNHFLLPAGSEGDPAAARYGVHAMELLINEIMKLGGNRQRLVAKVFGGAHVLVRASNTVPARNVAFVRQFLLTEQIPIVGECLGGDVGLEVWFHTGNGRAQVRRIAEPPASLWRAEAAERKKADDQLSHSDVTLF
jgi:chemotaxis protein methyltransferase CheR